ncbi:hypothetical protein [Streptacidiphilus sp. P02-A3a]|uniref:hypothetical protein n=1 Tax=Streptacidiphilus sp. P02-A3a TaxID=2704468 RepID=UPI0015F9BA9E|nr:hypothetical protein [Streptacidiphilus sp. P02-A3a]QMU72371.1 hypothetical protein GXP74_33130 [Streptacidiphilus sp. P02-A3a]
MSPVHQPSPDPEPGESSEAEFYAFLAERLRQAHARVRALDASDAAKASLTRSLLRITEAAKRDLPDAAGRLARFMEELDGGQLPQPPAH